MALMNKIALTAAIAITIITLFGSSIVNNPVFAQAIGGSAGVAGLGGKAGVNGNGTPGHAGHNGTNMSGTTIDGGNGSGRH